MQYTDKLTQTEIHTTCIRVKAKGANTLAWPTSADRTPTPDFDPVRDPSSPRPGHPRASILHLLAYIPYVAVHPMNMISDFCRGLAAIPGDATSHR